MTGVSIFDYEGQVVRSVTIDGEAWFVAADVCAVLDIGNPSQALSYLDEDERGSTLITNEGTSGNPSRAIVSEAGLYSLILRSRKPEAKAFKRWVTHEVLPAIRRTGSYGQPKLELDIDNREHLALIITAGHAALSRAVEAEAKVAELEPKAEAFETFLTAEGDYSVAAVAQMLGLGQNTLYARLRDEHILISGGRRHNSPYQQYLHHFRVVARTGETPSGNWASFTTYVKPSGVEFIRKVLKLQSVIPAVTS